MIKSRRCIVLVLGHGRETFPAAPAYHVEGDPSELFVDDWTHATSAPVHLRRVWHVCRNIRLAADGDVHQRRRLRKVGRGYCRGGEGNGAVISRYVTAIPSRCC